MNRNLSHTWILATVLILLGFFSCKKGHSYKEYIHFMNDEGNGFAKSYKNAEVTVKCIFQTPEYLAIQHSQGQPITSDLMENYRTDAENAFYFLLQITLPPESSKIWNDYFSYEMQGDIKIKSGAVLLPCTMYHAEVLDNIRPYRNILVGFDKKNCPGPDYTVIITPFKPLGSDLEFKFHENELKNKPELKI